MSKLGQGMQAGEEGGSTKCLSGSIHNVPSLNDGTGFHGVQTCLSALKASKEPHSEHWVLCDIHGL